MIKVIILMPNKVTNRFKGLDLVDRVPEELWMEVHNTVKNMVFPVVMYRCDSGTIKKAECQRIDAFELLEKTLESPLDSKEIKPVSPRGNQS